MMNSIKIHINYILSRSAEVYIVQFEDRLILEASERYMMYQLMKNSDSWEQINQSSLVPVYHKYDTFIKATMVVGGWNSSLENISPNLRTILVTRKKKEILISDRRTLTPDEAVRELQGMPERDKMFDFWLVDFKFRYLPN
jgi:hypothetical protein